jgi:FkbM family methyltransferase
MIDPNPKYLVPIDEIEWVNVPYIKTSEEGPVENHTFAYNLILPHFLATWDVWSYWERERIASMAKHLNKGDVLFDIGTEVGWMSLVFAEFVGAENMVLIEPTPEFWPNISETWKHNIDATPRACYTGLVGDKIYDTGEDGFTFGWPENIDTKLVNGMAYRYIHNNTDPEVIKDNKSRPETTIDELVRKHGVIPNALTMDTEGSELPILRGAEKTIKKYHPKIWVSVHPDLALRDYGVKDGETVAYLKSLGYNAEWLHTDHEEHWYFEYRGKK